MKVCVISLVLLIALVSENQSLKVHHSDQTDVNSLARQHRQARDRQAAVTNNVVTDPVHPTNIGQQQQVVATNLQNNYGYSGGDGQDSSLNYYYPAQQQQPQVQSQQQQQQQQQFQVQQPQQQQQYYNPYYYPQQQPHQNFLYPDKTRRQGPMKGGQDEGGLLGGVGGLFSGIFDMLGMSDDDDHHQQDPHGGGGDDGGLGGGLGGIGGGLGGAGLGFLKGKKLGWLGSGLLGLILSPVILPIIALWIAAIVLIIYFIPIPVIDAGNVPNKRHLRSDLYSPVQETMRLARSVLQSDQCVERMSCEIARVAKNYNFPTPDWIQRKMDSFNNKWVHRVSRSFKAVRGGSDCKQYSCPTIMSPFQKIRSMFFTARASSSTPSAMKAEGTKKSL